MMHVAHATILITALAVAACTPDARTLAERRAADARADSSAAGYDVAMTPPSRPAGDSGRTPGAGVVDSAKRDSTTPAATPVTVAPQTTPRPSTPPVRSPVIAVVDTGVQRAGTPTASRLPPLDPAVEATFLRFDETTKTATFQLTSGNELEDQVSFNGVRRGGRVLTIPLGWRLAIEFTNRDADLPHSATVVPGIEPVPEQIPASAFPQARSVKVDEGLLEGDSDEVSFVADREGRYFIACGVLGHAQRGQWLVLEISATAARPTYR